MNLTEMRKSAWQLGGIDFGVAAIAQGAVDPPTIPLLLTQQAMALPSLPERLSCLCPARPTGYMSTAIN